MANYALHRFGQNENYRAQNYAHWYLTRVIHGVFSQIAHLSSLERVWASFMGLFHNTSFGLDLASIYLIHGVNFTNAPFDDLSWGISQNGVDRPRSWGLFSQNDSFMGFGFRNAHSTSFSRHSASFMG